MGQEPQCFDATVQGALATGWLFGNSVVQTLPGCRHRFSRRPAAGSASSGMRWLSCRTPPAYTSAPPVSHALCCGGSHPTRDNRSGRLFPHPPNAVTGFGRQDDPRNARASSAYPAHASIFSRFPPPALVSQLFQERVSSRYPLKRSAPTSPHSTRPSFLTPSHARAQFTRQRCRRFSQFCAPSSPPATRRSPAPCVHASHDTPTVPHPPAVLIPGTVPRPSSHPPVDFRPASHPPTSPHLARSLRFFLPAASQPRLLRRVPRRIYCSAIACYH